MLHRTHESPTYTPAFVMTVFSVLCQLRSFYVRAGFSYKGGLLCIALLLSLFIYHSFASFLQGYLSMSLILVL